MMTEVEQAAKFIGEQLRKELETRFTGKKNTAAVREELKDYVKQKLAEIEQRGGIPPKFEDVEFYPDGAYRLVLTVPAEFQTGDVFLPVHEGLPEPVDFHVPVTAEPAVMKKWPETKAELILRTPQIDWTW